MSVRSDAEALAVIIAPLLNRPWGQSMTLTDLIEVILQLAADATHTPTNTL